MPVIRVAPDLEMNYVVDDYTDPWRKSEVILLLHGSTESNGVWFAWIPHLARQFRVVRPDMRGFGASTPMQRDYSWSLDTIIEDFAALMQLLSVSHFHVVGAKLGATVARRLAARYPERVRTLTLVGAPPPISRPIKNLDKRIEEYEQQGSEKWALRTMAGRLGSRFPQEGAEWWAKLMGRTPVSTQIGFLSTIPGTDISADLPRITCPTLVITTEGSGLASVEKTRAWQEKIPNSSLRVFPGDSFHVAASDADECARAAFTFISRVCAGSI